MADVQGALAELLAAVDADDGKSAAAMRVNAARERARAALAAPDPEGSLREAAQAFYDAAEVMDTEDPDNMARIYVEQEFLDRLAAHLRDDGRGA